MTRLIHNDKRHEVGSPPISLSLFFSFTHSHKLCSFNSILCFVLFSRVNKMGQKLDTKTQHPPETNLPRWWQKGKPNYQSAAPVYSRAKAPHGCTVYCFHTHTQKNNQKEKKTALHRQPATGPILQRPANVSGDYNETKTLGSNGAALHPT